jgi:CDP-diacylglycerol---glycerol-3-phosphate 3-phosphatidyltransferase
MLNRYARAFFSKSFTPLARLLLKLGVGPDAVTLVGTAGVVASALVFYPRGSFLVGTLAITAFIFSDLVDGTMARLSDRVSKWGAFLDSSMDRVGDAAIFGALAYYFAEKHNQPMFILSMVCLTTGAIVSYVRARAEGLGYKCNVGVIERGDRLVGSLVATGLCGLGVPYVQAIALWGIAIGSTVTVFQRMLFVRKQALSEPSGLGEPAGLNASSGTSAPIGPIAATGPTESSGPTELNGSAELSELSETNGLREST